MTQKPCNVYHCSEYQSWIGKSLIASLIYEHMCLRYSLESIIETKHFEHIVLRFMQIDKIESLVIFLLRTQRYVLVLLPFWMLNAHDISSSQVYHEHLNWFTLITLCIKRVDWMKIYEWWMDDWTACKISRWYMKV